MLSKHIAPGCKVDIMPKNRAKLKGVVTKQMYKSLIWDTISEDRLEIIMPIEKNRLISLPVEAEFDLYIYAQSGQFQCTAKIIDRYKSGNKPLLLFELIGELKKSQRREYFRLNCTREIGVRPLAEEEADAIAGNNRFLVEGLPLKKAVTLDISGGGIRFIGRRVYNPGSYLFCNLKLPVGGKEKEYSLAVKVLRMREVENNPGTYEHRVQFVGLNKKEREEIIQFIFEEERRQRKVEPL